MALCEDTVKPDKKTVINALKYFALEQADVTPLEAGLINRTWLTESHGDKYILQLVNPMFGMEVHDDIAAVTGHLHSKGLVTPRLIPTVEGRLCLQKANAVWRLFSHIEGVTYNAAHNAGIAGEAGKILGRFHHALLDLHYSFRNKRANVHETDRHLDTLQTALKTHRHHPEYENIRPLADEILEYAGKMPKLPVMNGRKVHGDPKITNCLFDPAGNGLCMLDFDTLGEMLLPLELGDAMRSWCNPGGENAGASTVFSIEHFRAALEGYAAETRDFILTDEWRSILPATRIICIELAARFCADALNESFFNWDKQRFNNRSMHNQVRAATQLNNCKSLLAQQEAALHVLEDVFS